MSQITAEELTAKKCQPCEGGVPRRRRRPAQGGLGRHQSAPAGARPEAAAGFHLQDYFEPRLISISGNVSTAFSTAVSLVWRSPICCRMISR